LDFVEDLLRFLWRGRLFSDRHAHRLCPTLHDANTLGSGTGEIDNTPRWLRVGSTVGDFGLGLLPGLLIFHHHLGAERQGAMGGGHFLLGEAVATGGLAPVKPLPIPTRLPLLRIPRIGILLPAPEY